MPRNWSVATMVGRTSSEKLREEDAPEAARKLGVGNVLIGSVRRSPVTIRISAQLVDGADDSERWSKSYDRAPGDALAIQTEIAEAVAKELSISLGLRQARLIAGGTTAAAALDFYFRSRALFYATRDRANTAQALALADAALRIDPNYAEAHAQRGADLDWQGAFHSTSARKRSAQLGDRSGSDTALRSLERIGGNAASLQFAEIHARRGEPDRAFAALDRALAVRDPGLTDLRTDFFCLIRSGAIPVCDAAR